MRGPERLDRTRRFLQGDNPDTRTLGQRSGVRIYTESEAMSGRKAPADGVYTLGRGRFRTRKGGQLPAGAVFEAKPLPADERRITARDLSLAEALALQEQRELEALEGAPENERAQTGQAETEAPQGGEDQAPASEAPASEAPEGEEPEGEEPGAAQDLEPAAPPPPEPAAPPPPEPGQEPPAKPAKPAKEK